MKRKMNVGFQAGKTARVAHPTGIHRVDFLSFCERVARSTSFNRQEVDAVLNMPQKLHVISYPNKSSVKPTPQPNESGSSNNDGL